jgi:toxin ParE1/3/4
VSQVRHTERARGDLVKIWVDIALDNPAAADRVYDRLEERFQFRARVPKLGAASPDIAGDARALVERPYLTLYRLIPAGVQIVRVLHGARQIDAALFNEGLE